MKIITLYFVCLVISLLFTILGAIFKIMHISYFELLFDIAIPFTLVFIVLGLKDVVSSNRFTGIEKLMWLTAFIFVSGIAGIVYYPRFRKNFLRREKPGLRYQRIFSPGGETQSEISNILSPNGETLFEKQNRLSPVGETLPEILNILSPDGETLFEIQNILSPSGDLYT